MAKVKPRVESDEQRAARIARWEHCALLGAAAMTEKNMGRIIASSTTTLEAKNIATQIDRLCAALTHALKTRIDHVS